MLLVVGTIGPLAACGPERANYEFGLNTTAITGQVDIEGAAVPHEDILVVVYQHHYLFSSIDGDERIYRVSATLAAVDEFGHYVVPMPSDVVRLDLMFVAPDRLSDEFQYSQQMGIGRVTYRALLRMLLDWRSHFYTYIQPSLSNLIIEPRYQLSLRHQKRLGDWLQTQILRLNTEGSSGADGEPNEAVIPLPAPDPVPAPWTEKQAVPENGGN